MRFERGLDSKVAMGVGREANPTRIQIVEEVHHENGRITIERLNLSDAQKLLFNICDASKEEALFNLQDRNIMLIDKDGNARDIRYMWGEYVCLPGYNFWIPEFLRPEGELIS